MNAQIKELTEQLPVASDVQKSIANRLESALTKTGSAQSRLRMASQSLNALANKYEADTDENGYADLFARIFAIGAEIGVDNKKPATEKTKRENWHDADSVEAKTILATKSPKKPRKNKSVSADEMKTEAHEQIALLLDVLNGLANVNSR
jgi:viroplasmin and RNaseH domain-containing protein